MNLGLEERGERMGKFIVGSAVDHTKKDDSIDAHRESAWGLAGVGGSGFELRQRH
ncbi:hypothetical protein Fmac_027280 [Flemingia macrophylla]|uniref:Uncharacterized protein n=1 Tax=Flemingia macrophylla TaxID=520843 RepID=A0ABD1LHA1_9FABA